MKYQITEEDHGVSVKDYLYKNLKFSTAMVKRVKYREGGIKVNGESVTVRRVLSVGDTLELFYEDTAEDENEYTVPVDLPLEIVYEDEYLTVVNKPPMMPSHPSLGHKNDTVANALAYRYRGAPYVFRPVNRLDRDTSGLMLIAGDKLTAGKLYLSQRKGQIHKSYLAILEGTLTPAAGEIKTYMAREGESIVKRRVCEKDDLGAKIAVTTYRTVVANENISVVKAHPVTGRTHQLRVHFAHMGCPILGDTMYGNTSELISRQALHAGILEFPHPVTGESLRLEAPLPEDMKKVLAEYGIKV